MRNSGRIVFILVCGIIGAVVSMWALPQAVEDVGHQIYSINRKIETDKAADDAKKNPPKQGNANQASGSPAIVQTAPDDQVEPKFRVHWAALAVLGFLIGAAIGSAFVRWFEKSFGKWQKLPIGDKVTQVVGLITGMLVGIVVSVPFMLMFQGRPEGTLVTIGLVLGCSSAMVYLLRSIAAYLPWETTSMRSKRTGTKILDTNVLIDGRVYDLMRTGFMDGDVYVPNFVLLELQHIADSADGLRRQRGRRGLDILKRIQAEFTVEVGTRDRYAGTENEEVDARLVKLAKALGADLVSNDFNLNRVATIQEVKVLNVNDLALALRPNVLPGEPLMVNVVREGNQLGQGIAYLDDGTMVVVEGGQAHIGENLSVAVTQVIQTERGKMIFADVGGEGETDGTFQARRKSRPGR